MPSCETRRSSFSTARYGINGSWRSAIIPTIVAPICILSTFIVLAALGFSPLPVADTPGLVVARTLAMLINEAADAVLQGVCDADAADAAMKLGVNYPAGPFEWLGGWSVAGVMEVLAALDRCYRGERYRISPWLRRAVALAPR